MSMTFRILDNAGRDNALLVQVDSGQAVETLLFDCGDACLSELPFSETKSIDHLFFSHLHMDHVGGFDTFFRCNMDRANKSNHVWGPPATSQILQHRFQGFLWNLHESMSGTWYVHDVYPGHIQDLRFELKEAFAMAHAEGTRNYQRTIVEGAGFTVETLTMDHKTPCLAYRVREKPRQNVEMSRLKEMGLKPGPWLKELKSLSGEIRNLLIEGKEYHVEHLRKKLLVDTKGDSIAYLTDFLLDTTAMNLLTPWLYGCCVLVCEAQYRHADQELAMKNHHMTNTLGAILAKSCQPEELILFHLSDRYLREDWVAMLAEARSIFPCTRFPEQWKM